MGTKLNKAVIPVAGLGTRMLPATKAIPKELLPVFDRPIIEHVVSEAVSAGIKEIVLITRSGKEAIENHFDANYELEHRLEKKGKETILGTVKNILPDDVKISSIRQGDALGLGHAVLSAKTFINDEPFAVLLPDVLLLDKESNGDNYSFNEMVSAWNRLRIGQVMVEQVDPNQVESYGVVDIKGAVSKPFISSHLAGIIEKPCVEEAPSNLVSIGRYILPPSVLDILETTSAGVGGEIQLTDALDELSKSQGLNAFETDAQVFDCGNKEGFLIANLAMAIRDPLVKGHLLKFLEENFS